MYDENFDKPVRKTSTNALENEYSNEDEPVSKIKAYNTNKPNEKRTFFTSKHIKMIERDPNANDKRAMTMKRNEFVKRGVSASHKHEISAQIQNKWIKSDEDEYERGDSNQLMNVDRSMAIKQNATNLNLESKHGEAVESTGHRFRNTPSNSNTDIRSRIKKLKITSQIE